MSVNEIIKKIKENWTGQSTDRELSREYDNTYLLGNKYRHEAVDHRRKRIDLKKSSGPLEFKIRQSENNLIETTVHTTVLEERKERFVNEGLEEINGEEQLNNIRRNAFVESVEIFDSWIKIKTKDIVVEYHNHEEDEKMTLNIGSYILEFSNSRKLPQIYNDSYCGLSYPHPCVDTDHDLCTGSYDRVLSTYIKDYRFDLFIDTIIKLLQNGDDSDAFVSYTVINNSIKELENLTI